MVYQHENINNKVVVTKIKEARQRMSNHNAEKRN